MGTFEWPLRITGSSSERSAEIEATVDTGAFYTMVPSYCPLPFETDWACPEIVEG